MHLFILTVPWKDEGITEQAKGAPGPMALFEVTATISCLNQTTTKRHKWPQRDKSDHKEIQNDYKEVQNNTRCKKMHDYKEMLISYLEKQNQEIHSDYKEMQNNHILLPCRRVGGPLTCLCPGTRCLTQHLIQHTVSLKYFEKLFFFPQKWRQISEKHFPFCVYQDTSQRALLIWSHMRLFTFNMTVTSEHLLCSLFPFSAWLGHVLCVSLQMCLVQITVKQLQG